MVFGLCVYGLLSQRLDCYNIIYNGKMFKQTVENTECCRCQMSVVAQIWPQVKAANPHLSSVTEIGAVVGAMWRDLDPVEKQRYNDQFNKQKVTMKLLFHGSPPPSTPSL